MGRRGFCVWVRHRDVFPRMGYLAFPFQSTPRGEIEKVVSGERNIVVWTSVACPTLPIKNMWGYG